MAVPASAPSAYQGTQVVILADSLAADTTITISTAANIVSDDYQTIGPAVGFGPNGTAFSVPATVTLPFNPGQVPSGAQVVILRKSGDSITELVPASPPGEGVQSVSADTGSFSTFQAAFGKVRIRHFTATPVLIDAGTGSVLSWEASRAASCTISGIGSVALPTGTLEIFPDTHTVYQLACNGPQGPVSANVTVTVNQPPNGVIDTPAGNVTVDAGGAVDFTGTCTDDNIGGSTYTHLWDFGGGATNSTAADPGSVTFGTPGVYTVSYTCTDARGIADPSPASVTVTVNGPPNGVIDTPAGNVTVDAGEAVGFTGTCTDDNIGGSTYTHLWDFGGGATNSTAADPGSVTFGTPGVYTVSYTCTDARGIADPSPASVTVTVVGTIEVTDFDWEQVSAGHLHTCGVKTGGRLFCWGNSQYGRLGNNDTSNFWYPVPIQEYTNAEDWAQVSAGGSHTCAVKTNGTLFCWGFGGSGQIGNNSYSPTKLVPVQEYTAANDWAQVSAGGSHTCAVKTDGRLFCWGNNISGELGNNSTSTSSVPVQEYTAEANWAQVSAGGSHTCAVKTDGRLFCWGNNISGELGNNSTSTSSVPVQEYTAAANWAQVSAGGSHTCAVKTDGRLFCWGSDISGELGNDFSILDKITPVQEYSAATDWIQVSSRYGHTCAVKIDGQLFCWGHGYYGQLGNDPTSFLDGMIPVQEYTAGTDWVQVSTGGAHTCALKNDGQILCWGLDRDGQRGDNPSAFGSLIPIREYTKAIDWIQVSAGGSHTCAVKTDGRLFCWGSGGQGQLGNNFASLINAVPVQEYTAEANWAQVSAGSSHTCAVKTDGRLFCWGSGGQGRLGNNSTSTSPVPVQEYTAAANWAQVSAGGSHTCAVKTDGRLFCWGLGVYGQLGNNSTSDSSVPVQEYTAAANWAQVSAGLYHTCAVKTDGRLFCWGYGGQGRLGNNSTSTSPVPVQEYTAAANWAQVSAGGYHTCAVKTDGRLFCWGSNIYGELGNNSTSNSSVPVQEYTAAVNWAQGFGGLDHTCGVKIDGQLFCWGRNIYGELGNNSTSTSSVPIREFIAATNWLEVSGGAGHTCAVKANGRILCWGYDYSGELGWGWGPRPVWSGE